MALYYKLDVQYGEATYGDHQLQYWEKKRRSEIAYNLVSQASFSFTHLPFGRIGAPDLQDCVRRASEQFLAKPDDTLDLYWAATRGVITYFTPLQLGLSGRDYLPTALEGGIGEGLALYFLEDTVIAPKQFGYQILCRPLGASPDLFLEHAQRPGEIALVEAKATEGSAEAALRKGVQELLEILPSWRGFHDLRKTAPFVVATSIESSQLIEVLIVRLIYV